MSTSCHGLLEQLVQCLRESDCFKKEHKDIKRCAREAEECSGLRFAYFKCKRGQIDPRSRIQGNKGGY
ncbi:hypothetical protein WJX72_010335 [[Myrmecia] bisecta]|uniref:Cytochrome c oxidase assembly factor 5 n=1 Tax=[Myrmecia] bisecta TaxID=41462 RepID=A0AAW1QG84_9CHLO